MLLFVVEANIAGAEMLLFVVEANIATAEILSYSVETYYAGGLYSFATD